MELIKVYQCLCDLTRLRILHLLGRGPLCVCHFQGILGLPQVQVSKHLAYLRRRGMVHTRKEGVWVHYSLPAHPSPELEANLKCLQDCCREHPMFAGDAQRLAAAANLPATARPAECCP